MTSVDESPVTIPRSSVERILEGLEDAIQQSYDAVSDQEQRGYPYAYGYLSASIKSTISDLQSLLKYYV
jgi:hypothetical protein